MPVHASENDRYARLCTSLLVGVCLLWLSAQGATAAAASQQPPTKEEYELDQSKRVQNLKRLNNSLVTPEIFAEFKAAERQYRNILRTGTNGRVPKEMAELRAGLKYRVLTLSDPDIQAKPGTFEASNKNLFRDLSGAASQANVPNAQQRRQFRELLCSETMPLLQQMLTEGNLLARTAALQRMLDLEVVPPRGGARMQMYDKVDKVYIQVLADSKQPDAVKTVAASCIKTYLQKADAIPQIEIALAEAIAKELDQRFLSPGYQMALLQALEEVRAPRQLVGKKAPVVYCAMAKLMTNRSIDIQVRCRAARVMGRTGWDGKMSFDTLAWATSELALETAFLFNNSNAKQDPKWAYCGWYLYTAFHHEDAPGAIGNAPSLPKGFLNRAPQSPLVRAAYTNGVGLMAHLMYSNNKPVAANEFGPLLKWNSANKPANLMFDPACPPIQAQAGPPAPEKVEPAPAGTEQ